MKPTTRTTAARKPLPPWVMTRAVPIGIGVLVLSLIISSAMAYVWYLAQQQTRALVALAVPYADVRYESVQFSLNGQISIENLKVQPYGGNTTLQMTALRLNSQNIFALVHTLVALKQGTMPDTLSIALDNAELLSRTENTANGTLPKMPLADWDALGCGSITHFGPAEYRAMGYPSAMGRTTLSYFFDATQQQLMATVAHETMDGATGNPIHQQNITAGFAIPAWPISGKDFFAKAPQLVQAQWTLQDRGFHAQRNRYCAEKSGQSPKTYAQHHLQTFSEHLREMSVVPGQNMWAAYSAYLSGEEIVITATPPTGPLNPTDLMNYDGLTVSKMLGLSGTIKSAAVTDFPFAWSPQQLASRFKMTADPIAAEELPDVSTVEVRRPVEQKVELAYQPIPLEKLHTYTGKMVRLRTVAHAEYKGRLEGIEEDLVRIMLRKPGGSAVFSLRKKDVTSAEALQ